MEINNGFPNINWENIKMKFPNETLVEIKI